MGKPDKAGKGAGSKNPAQTEKRHEVLNPDGSAYVETDEAGNQVSGMTQEQWRNRDKTAGFTRPDDEEETAEEPVAPAG